MTALPPLPTPDTHCFDDDTGTQALWPQMISALAAIDRELGLPDDGCNSTALTLNAIRMMNLAHRDDVKAITSLEGERAVLIGILTDCAAVLQTIEPDNSDEAEKLADLLGAIDRAQAPSRHKGALL